MKVVVKRLKPLRTSKEVVAKRTIGGSGKTLLSVNGDSRTFGQDFQDVFTRSVRRARRANKRLAGHSDGADANS